MLRIVRFLGNRYAGFVLGLLIVAALALGSLAMNLNSDIYPPFFPFNIRFFFNPIQAVHSWFYVLFLLLFLFGINTAACSLDSIHRLLKTRHNTWIRLIALLFHLTLGLAFSAHLWEGLSSQNHTMPIGIQETRLPGIGFAKLESAVDQFYPDGSLKDTEARIVFRSPRGGTTEKRVSYNSPALFDWGTKEVLIQRSMKRPVAFAVTEHDRKNRYVIAPGKSTSLPGGTVDLKRIIQRGMRFPFAVINWRSDKGETKTFFLALDSRAQAYNRLELSGKSYIFKEIIYNRSLLVLVRSNPAVLLLGACILMLLTASVLLIVFYLRNQPYQT